MKKIVLLLLFSGLWFRLIAEQAPYKMHELLLKTNLVAHVQLSASGHGFFRLQVLEVLHRKKSGIIKGDYIKVKYDFDVVCPPTFPKQFVTEKKKALAFLTHYNGQWHLTQGKIAFIEEDKAEVYFHEEGFVYRAPIEQWKKSIAEYHQHFTLNQEGKVLVRNKKIDSLAKKFTFLVQMQYVSLGLRQRNTLEDYPYIQKVAIVAPPERQEEVEQNQEKIYDYAATPPFTDSIQLSIQRELLAQIEKNVPILKAKGISGRNYYSLLIEKDGRISKVKIYRMIDSLIGKEIERYFSNHNQWNAALNEKGDKIRFEQRMVLKIVPEK